MSDGIRAVAAIGLSLVYMLGLLGIAYVGNVESATIISWPLALVLMATFSMLADSSARSLSSRTGMLYLAVAVVYFGGLWFISNIVADGLGPFVWPLTTVAVMLVAMINIDRIASVFRQSRIIIRRVIIGGVEVELDRAAVDRVERELSSSIRTLFDSIDREYRRQVRIRRVELLLGKVHRRLPQSAFPEGGPAKDRLEADDSLRSTVHIRDVAFQEFMYQLTDYANARGGSGAGRRFSKRRGIVGRAWRIKESLGQGDVFSGHADKARELREKWGMFEAETGPALERPSCLSIILKGDDGQEVGLLYVDSKRNDAFGDDAAAGAAAKRLENDEAVRELGKAVGNVDSIMKELALNFDLAKLTV